MNIAFKADKVTYKNGRIIIKGAQSDSNGSGGGLNNVLTEGSNHGIQMSNCQSTGSYAVAEGYNTVASGKYGSHAEGAETEASGVNAHSEGGSTIASGGDSHAEGQFSEAQGSRSHAEGFATIAAAEGAHSEGDHTLATGQGSHSEGADVEAFGYRAHAEGYGNINEESFSAVVVYVASANSGDFPHEYSIQSSDNGFTNLAGEEGVFRQIQQNNNNINSTKTYANGYYDSVSQHLFLDTKLSTPLNDPTAPQTITIAYGVAVKDACHSEGHSSVAMGETSHAEGSMTIAYGDYSHAEGKYTRTLNDFEHAQGNYNLSHKASDTYGNAGNTIHSIGIGSSSQNRKNAVEVMQNGDLYIKGIGGYDGTNMGSTGVQTLQDSMVKIWRGTQVQYDALSPNYDDNTIYIVT